MPFRSALKPTARANLTAGFRAFLDERYGHHHHARRNTSLLPEDEAAQLRFEFETEMERLKSA